METGSQRNSKPSWDPLSKADASVFNSILKGNKHANKLWASHIKRTKSLSNQANSITLRTMWHFFGFANFETRCEKWEIFQCLRFACETVAQTLCFTQDVLSERKRDVCAHRGAVSLPMRNRFLLTQLLGGYVMERLGGDEDIYCKHCRTDTLVIKHLGLNISTKHARDLFAQMSLGLVIWTDFHCDVYRLLMMTHKHRAEKHSSYCPSIRPRAARLKGLIHKWLYFSLRPNKH